MDDALAQSLIRLPKGSVRRMAVRRGDGIALFEGEVWITQDRQPEDVIVTAGESHDFTHDADALVQALHDAVLIRLGRADDLSGLLPRFDPAAGPTPHIDAYALAREARPLRDAAVARAVGRLVRATCSALSWLLQTTRQRPPPQLADVGPHGAAVHRAG